jgi:hypothetical protein
MGKTVLKQDATLTADLDAIRRDLSYMTARWGELPEPAMFEVRAFKEHCTPKTAKFAPDWLDGPEGAIAWIAGLNRLGYNVYAVRNPIRRDAGPSASDKDILAACFLWADCDDPASAGNVYRFEGPKWSAAVKTGRTPSIRVHTYWELETPCTDLAAWRDMQVRIAAHFGSDSTVVNPSRIMRIGGTVSWPDSKKQARGYVPEIVTLRTEYDEPRRPVTLEQMGRVFPAAQPSLSLQAAPGAFAIDTGATPAPLDRDRAAIAAMTGQEWHHNVIRLVASYVARGLSDAEIHALTDPLTLAGYTIDQTRREVQQAIDGARRKGFAPSTPTPQEIAPAAQPAEPLPPFDTTPLSPRDLVGIAPRRWVYGAKLVRGFCSVLASPGGMGKSAYVTAAALDMAAGIETLHDRPHGALRVWLYNLEDPRDETLRKVAAAMMHKRIPAEALGNLVVTSGRDRSLIVAEEVERGLIVARPDVAAIIDAIKAARIDVLTVDPIVRSHRVQENDNKQVDFVMDLYARIADEADCAVLLVHHTRKGFVSGDADSIRGGSAMTSAARVAFTIQAMQAEEAQRLNIPEADRKRYVRVDNAKANLAPPSERAEWLKLESQSLGNGTEEYPDGDFIQVVTKWQPPLPWEGLGGKITEIFDRIHRGHVDEDGNALPYGDHKNSGDRWVVNAVLASFPDGDFSEAQALGCLGKWKADGFLTVKEGPQGRDRKPLKKCVFVVNRPDQEVVTDE